MDFVIDNYLWFIIGAIVLLMIIIGYFAEKTNFGKIPLNSNKEKKEKTIEEDSTPVEPDMTSLENVGIADAVAPEEPINVSDVKDSVSEDVMPEEDLNVPFGDAKVEEPHEIEPTPEVTEKLPDIPEVPEIKDTEDNGISDESEDDVWKF